MQKQSKVVSMKIMVFFRSCFFLMAALFIAGDLLADPVAITSLDLGKIQQGFGTPQIDLAVEKQPLMINGKAYAHGLGTHADSYFAINLGQGSTRLTALVGIDDEAANGLARVKFMVYGDGKVLWQSDDLSYHQDAQPLDVNVTGVKTLLLVVVGTGDGNRFDHAD